MSAPVNLPSRASSRRPTADETPEPDQTANGPLVPVAPPQTAGLALSAKVEYAKLLASSGLLPAQYRKQPANLLWAIEYGEMLGLTPMAAITGVHVIEGKPTASAGLISALVRRAGHRLRIKGDDQRATCTIIRADDPDHPFTVEWTMDRAKQAGLTGKDVWRKYPAAMLKARAITECARDACEEALSGVRYTPEELGAAVDEDGSVATWDTVPEPSGNGTAPTRAPATGATPSPVGTPVAGQNAQDFADLAAVADDPDDVRALGAEARAAGLLPDQVSIGGLAGTLGDFLAHRIASLRGAHAADGIVDADVVDDGPTVDDARAAAEAWEAS